MKSIEIQRQQADQWVHHAYYDNAEMALSEARRLVEINKFPGIRVIQDEFDGDGGESKSKYLFVSSGRFLGDDGPAGKAAPGGASQGSSAASAQTGDYFDETRIAVVDETKVKSLHFPLIMLVILLALGGGTLIGLKIYLGEF